VEDIETIEALGTATGLTYWQVYGLIRAGKLAGFKVGKKWYVARSEWDAYVEREQAAAAAEAAAELDAAKTETAAS